MNIIQLARTILEDAEVRGLLPEEIARFYHIPLWVVTDPEQDMGTIYAREIVRIEIARKDYEKRGIILKSVSDKMRYKGTRT